MKPYAREQYGDDFLCADLLPELPTVGWDRFRSAAPQSLAPHVHPRAYEVCYLADGTVDWWAAQETYTLRRGDITVTRPGEWHGGVHSVMHPCELRWCQVVPDDLPVALQAGLATLAGRVFAGTEAVPQAFDALLSEHRASALPLAELAARAALHALLVAVLRCADAAPKPPAVSPMIAAALNRLTADLTAPCAVEAVAKAVGLSAPRFVERFCRETGETPGQWRTGRRLQAAQTALREPGATVTEVAYRFGWTSSQYFATAFKRRFGLSPGEWRGTKAPTLDRTRPVAAQNEAFQVARNIACADELLRG